MHSGNQIKFLYGYSTLPILYNFLSVGNGKNLLRLKPLLVLQTRNLTIFYEYYMTQKVYIIIKSKHVLDSTSHFLKIKFFGKENNQKLIYYVQDPKSEFI